MDKKFLYVANWKMCMDLRDAIEFGTTYNDELVALGLRHDIILCPSFISIYPLQKMFATTPIAIGAQDCSNHSKGSFTGQVCAQSLHEAGCTWCIIGHSERRAYLHETDLEVAQKLVHLIDFDISPIICIGEGLEDHQNNTTLKVLAKQLAPIRQTLSTLSIPSPLTITIAYEPVWSIGTGKIATNDHLETTLAFISQELKEVSLTTPIKLLYGGSVNEDNIQNLKKIAKIDGFLIGGASLSFQKLKKIVD